MGQRGPQNKCDRCVQLSTLTACRTFNLISIGQQENQAKKEVPPTPSTKNGASGKTKQQHTSGRQHAIVFLLQTAWRRASACEAGSTPRVRASRAPPSFC